jgi:hypothetical protein
MSQSPLMPKATAVWLVENTSLTFEQIAEFCHLHPLEVKGIADGEVAQGIKGADPITSGQLTRDEIDRAAGDANHRLKMAPPKVKLPEIKPTRRGPRYTPVSRRHDRPNAILWLIRNHPELKDAQIIRLVGTTKTTIQQIRERTHWNSASLQPMDPVTLGLCSQIDLDLEVKRAAVRTGGPMPDEVETGTMLLSAEEALATSGGRTGASAEQPVNEDGRRAQHEEDIDAESVFAKLKTLKNEPTE